ncbi:unnamed protein product [Allacma fusca]|uniref:Uncharacterized protein n=1 Tax=Allacma fusca TaxID=39272 RepID=A0A8J2KQZ6_9HEXA|nr:unnamed protein product [Allacma fusca]
MDRLGGETFSDCVAGGEEGESKVWGGHLRNGYPLTRLWKDIDSQLPRYVQKRSSTCTGIVTRGLNSSAILKMMNQNNNRNGNSPRLYVWTHCVDTSLESNPSPSHFQQGHYSCFLCEGTMCVIIFHNMSQVPHVLCQHFIPQQIYIHMLHGLANRAFGGNKTSAWYLAGGSKEEEISQ